jgi:hypothetical protein
MKALSTIVGVVVAALSGVAAAQEGIQLAKLEMPVMVNQGEKYVDAQTNMLLQPGDRIMALGGSAEIVHENGCVQTVDGNNVAEVLTAERCAEKVAALGATSRPVPAMASAPVGSGTTAGGTLLGGTTGAVVVGGAIVATVIAADEIGGSDGPAPAPSVSQ